MKLCQISDTHLGITKEKAIRRLCQDIAAEEFDVLVHCGDYCGGQVGHKTLRKTVEIIREYLPGIPFVSVIGNHDFWSGVGRGKSNPGLYDFTDNYEKIVTCFKTHNVHFLDKDGPYQHPAFPRHTIIGNSGWYLNPRPPTNDENFLPIGIEGDTNRYLLRQADAGLIAHTNAIRDRWQNGADTLIFVSHFPVVNSGPDYKGGFELFSWDAHISKFLQEDWRCKHFLNGHAHQLHKGPLRWECGSDYYKPSYQIIEV